MLIFLVLFVGYVWDQVRLYWAMRQAEQLQQQQQPPVQQPQPQVHIELNLVGSAISSCFLALDVFNRFAVEGKYSTVIVYLSDIL